MKRILLLFAVLFCTMSASAQVGIIGGLTSTHTDLKGAWADKGNLNMYHAGILARMSLVKGFLYLQPALIYNVKGANLQELSAASAESFQLKTGYLELPVQLQAGFSLGKALRLYGLAEPFAGLALNSDMFDGDQRKESMQNLKTRWEWGVGLGAGVELFEHVQVSLKYFWNFGNPYNSDIQFDGNNVFSNFDIEKCGGISLSLALIL